MSQPTAEPVVNVDEAEEHEAGSDSEHYHQFYKVLTPAIGEKPGALGVNVTRLPAGKVGCPFHYHLFEDEVFFVLSGSGVLRYGDELISIRAGDCIACPAGTQVAHQIANTGAVDLVYLAIGCNHPHEVCGYPDSGKVMVRSLKRVGWLEATEYMQGEPSVPKIFELARAAKQH